MTHHFTSNATHYWTRVVPILLAVASFTAIPSFVETANNPSGFQLIGSAILTILLGSTIYLRPQTYTVQFTETEVKITNKSERVIYSSSLNELESISLARWGLVVGHPIGWIAIKKKGADRPQYIGAISGHQFQHDDYTRISEDFFAITKQ
ncbi:hypothetical protein [Persicirhabdus sediminis]|uniref:Uncharacterized protein n=1 Tax=Persicirhabdus sediminis TaxID=454144 RepID=A0A8J7SKW6_9BACT|nr:hypothetical protein [Persicirhabdus sediminis]MBK1790023.1 hypothetical protein [Persicirhabdus sediminis]